MPHRQRAQSTGTNRYRRTAYRHSSALNRIKSIWNTTTLWSISPVVFGKQQTRSGKRPHTRPLWFMSIINAERIPMTASRTSTKLKHTERWVNSSHTPYVEAKFRMTPVETTIAQLECTELFVRNYEICIKKVTVDSLQSRYFQLGIPQTTFLFKKEPITMWRPQSFPF